VDRTPPSFMPLANILAADSSAAMAEPSYLSPVGQGEGRKAGQRRTARTYPSAPRSTCEACRSCRCSGTQWSRPPGAAGATCCSAAEGTPDSSAVSRSGGLARRSPAAASWPRRFPRTPRGCPIGVGLLADDEVDRVRTGHHRAVLVLVQAIGSVAMVSAVKRASPNRRAGAPSAG
jgi:hypothetical protein